MLANRIKNLSLRKLCFAFFVFLLLAFPGFAGAQDATSTPSPTPTPEPKVEPTPADPDYIASVDWSPDGARVAVSRGPLLGCNKEGREYVVDIVEVSSGNSLQKIPSLTNCVAPSVAWNLDGTRLVVSGSDQAASTIWNMITVPQLLAESQTLSGEDALDAWSPDGILLAQVSQNADGFIWDSRRGELIAHCCNEAEWGIPLSVGWSPGTANIIAGYENGTAAIWDSRDHRQLEVLTGHNAPIHAAAFNRDGSKIATADWDGFIQVWDGLTGDLLIQFQDTTHTGIRTLAWSPNGDELATAGEDGTVHVWDTIAGEIIDVFESTGIVHDVDWSPDGTRLIYGGESTDGYGTLEVVLAPTPNRCDLTVSAADTPGFMDALASANGSAFTSVICLTESTYVFSPQSITALYDADGLNAVPSITKTIIINGNGAILQRDETTGFDFRFFHVAGSGTLILKAITLSGGVASSGENGGAIVSEGNLTLVDTILMNNRADSGGAIDNSGISASIIGSELTGNTAVGDDGGAVANSGGSLDVIESTFFNNSASDNGGALDIDPGVVNIARSLFSLNTAGGDGGSVYMGAGELAVEDTIFHSNSALDEGGSLLVSETVIAQVNRSTFNQNSAADKGGAIANDGTLTTSESCFTGNEAVDFADVAGAAPNTTILNNWWGPGGPVPANGDNEGGSFDTEAVFQPFLTTMPEYCDVTALPAP
jgi:predicted outer membrane repeat protein